MGYYSQVAMLLRFEDQERRDALISKLEEPYLGTVLEMIGLGWIDLSCPTEIRYEDDDIKWYPGEPVVEAVVALRDLAKEVAEDGGILSDGFFAEVGEDTGDITEMYWVELYAELIGEVVSKIVLAPPTMPL